MKLPKHVVRIKRGDRYEYRFIVKNTHRPEGWPATIRLPDDPEGILREARALQDKLDAVRAHKAETAPPGSLNSLMDEWRASSHWAALKPKTQLDYEQGWKRLEKWSAKNNQPHISTIQWKHVLKILSVYEDRRGVHRQVRNVMMRLWTLGYDRGLVSAEIRNELRSKRRWNVAKSDKQKQTVTYDQMLEIVALCDLRGRQSMGTAVMIAFDIMQYPVDIIPMRFGEHYKPAEGVFCFDRQKTGIPAIVPASAALRARIGQADRMFILVNETTGRPYTRDNFNKVWRRCIAKTGYEGFQFSWFRHSGVKESDSAGVDNSAIDAMGAWKPGGSGKAVRDAHYRSHNADLARQGMAAREAYRNGK